MEDKKLKEIKKIGFMKLAPYNKELFDYDYLDKLSPDELNYLKNFHDEEYNASYNNEYKSSVYYYSQEWSKLKKDEEKYNEFLVAYNKTKHKYAKKGISISEKQFFVKLQQRSSTNAKRVRREDIYNNYSNLSNGDVFQKFNNVNTKKSRKIISADSLNVEEHNIIDNYIDDSEMIEVDNLAIYIKNGLLTIYIAEKMVEYIDGKDISIITKKGLINVLNTLQDNFKTEYKKSLKVRQMPYLHELYKLFTAMYLKDNKNKELSYLHIIFDKLVYTDKAKVINNIYKK